MGRPTKGSNLLFTSRELAVAADLSSRNIALLHEEGLAPTAVESETGRGGHRLYTSVALAHAALIGALHLAGFELLVSARLAQALADDFGAMRGKLHSNMNSVARAHRALFSGHPEVHTDDDFWLFGQLVDRVVDYRPSHAAPGDVILEIADHHYVLTASYGPRALKVFSPVLKDGMAASPDYRIIGRGASVRVVSIADEIDSMDFAVDPASAARYRSLQLEYLAARENAVTLVRVNVSLAIRNAFGRVHQDRLRMAA
jgi:DNA-binding transcriptional MerR regulator